MRLVRRDGPVNLLVDVVGWFAAGSSFASLVPARLLDSRWWSTVMVVGGVGCVGVDR